MYSYGSRSVAPGRVVRTLQESGEPMVVFISAAGKVDVAPANGLRHQSLLRMPGFIRRCAGVFDALATEAEVGASLRAVRESL